MTLEQTFSDWLDFLAENGFAAASHLNNGATDEEIIRYEEAIRFRLPDEYRDLYKRANGQKPIWDIKNPSPGKFVSPLFGGYYFESLEESLRVHHRFQSIVEESNTKELKLINEHVTVRKTDPSVSPVCWKRGWIPFASDGGGNALAFDLSPPLGGFMGQIIIMGSDEDQRRVLGKNLKDYLDKALKKRNFVLEEWDAEPPIEYFKMKN